MNHKYIKLPQTYQEFQVRFYCQYNLISYQDQYIHQQVYEKFCGYLKYDCLSINQSIKGYGPQRVQTTKAQKYRPQRHKKYGPQRVWSTKGMVHKGKGTQRLQTIKGCGPQSVQTTKGMDHKGYGPQRVWTTIN